MNELITKNSEWIIHFMTSIDRLLDSFEHLTANYRPTLGGKILYRESDIERMLSDSYRPAYRLTGT